MNDWRSMDDAPKDGTAILAWVPRQRGASCDVILWFEGAWYDQWGSPEAPTHWTPLPDEPVAS